MPDIDEWSALLSQRRSVRDFRPDPIPQQVLEAVLSDALRAPSWSNTQPYWLAVASGRCRDTLSEQLCLRFDAATQARDGGLLAKARILLTRQGLPDGDFTVPTTYPDELQPRRQAVGRALYEALGINRDDGPARDRQLRRNFEFFGAPTVIFVFVHAGLREYSVLDAGVMLQTLMLSASARGLGTCAQGALALWAGPVRKEFQIPKAARLLCGVAIGYASDHPVNDLTTARAPLTEILLQPRLP